MILEETIPGIFLPTPPYMRLVWGGRGEEGGEGWARQEGFPLPIREASVAHFNQVPWRIHSHSPYPLKFPSPPPTLPPPFPSLSSPTCKVH